MKNEKEKESVARVVGSAHTEAERATASAVLPDSQRSLTPAERRPFFLTTCNALDDDDCVCGIADNDGWIVCEFLASAHRGERADQSEAGNDFAEYFLRAANSFPALMEALRFLADTVESYQRGDDDAVPLSMRGVTASDVSNAVNSARQVLKLATGQ